MTFRISKVAVRTRLLVRLSIHGCRILTHCLLPPIGIGIHGVIGFEAVARDDEHGEWVHGPNGVPKINPEIVITVDFDDGPCLP